MPILDKNLLLAEIEERLNNYIPANTTRQIINDAAEVMTRYEVTRLKPDDGSDDSEQLIELFLNAKERERIHVSKKVNGYIRDAVRASKKSSKAWKGQV